MLHKCANPSCDNAFLKLTEGKLFLVETDQPKHQVQSIVSKKTSFRRIEHYWLCDACSPVLTLAYESGRGIVAVPLTCPPKRMPPAAELHAELATAGTAQANDPYYRRA